MTAHQKHDRETEANIIKAVAQHGWFVAKFPATDYLPSFCYTIGLWKNYQHPELISFGLTTETLHSILNIGGELVKEGHKLQPDKAYDEFFEQGTAMVINVDERSLKDYFGYGFSFNGGTFPAMQIVWPDRNDKLPWEEGFEEEFIDKQPLLDRNFDYKYVESKDTAVFTTTQYLEQNKPILSVIHDHEGDWQFLTNDQKQEDRRMVCLGHLIDCDKTLNELFNLEYGEYAERKTPVDRWVRGILKDE